jgi:hypothetical protein
MFVMSKFFAKCIYLIGLEKFQEVTICFVCLSVRLEHLDFYWTDFDQSWYLKIFRKIFEKVKVALKSDNSKGYFACTCMYIHLWYSQAEFFLE